MVRILGCGPTVGSPRSSSAPPSLGRGRVVPPPSLIDQAYALCSTTKNRQDEIKHVKDTLKLNSYPNTTLIKIPSNRTEQQFKGFAIIPYYPGLAEKIRRCLSNHNVKTVLKPCNTIGKKLANHKDSVDPNMRRGAVYQIPCHDCDFSHIGETKHIFSIRKKEHLAETFGIYDSISQH